MQQTLLLSMILARLTAAAPSVYPVGYCPELVTTYTASAGPVYWDPPILDVAAATCGSTAVNTCPIGVSQSITNGIIITVGGSLTLDIPEIGSLAFSPSVSYTYSTTKGTTDGVTCPAASPFYTCGMTSTSPFQDITGIQTSSGGGAYPACNEPSTAPYTIKSPAQGDNLPRWDPCISSNSANQATLSGLALCPS